ncbi:MAG: hypothetical protein HWN68_12425 [Desulfobacterales bacterium]|nr:hypothetical protein [Desulfobacterales bacterium]
MISEPLKTQGNEKIKQLLKQITDLKKKLGNLTRLMKNYSKIETKSLESLQKLNFTLLKIERRASSLEEGSLKDSLMIWIEEEQKELEEINTKLKSRFLIDLDKSLREKGLNLKGRMHNLKCGFYTIDIDLINNRCKLYYGPKEEFIVILKLDIETITQFIVHHRKQLDASFSYPAIFLSQLNKAYKAVTNRLEDQHGKKAPIIDVMVELSILKQSRKFRTDPLRENFQDYGRVQFSYDLYRIIQIPTKTFTLRLSTATRSQARNRGEYLWVPKNERGDGTIYSYIELRRLQDV